MSKILCVTGLILFSQFASAASIIKYQITQAKSLPANISRDVVTDPHAADLRRLGSADRELLSKLVDTELVTAGTQKAFITLDNAIKKTTKLWSEVFVSIRDELQSAKINWPLSGYDYEACTPGTIAFVYQDGPNIIFLCAVTVYVDRTDKFLSQVLIHEGAHLAGYFNECDATEIEVRAMHSGGSGLSFRNGYMDRCKNRYPISKRVSYPVLQFAKN